MVAAPARGAPPLPHSLFAQISYGLFIVVGLFALLRGDRLMRTAGAVLLAETVLTPLLQDRVDWMDPEARLLALDCVVLAFFLGLALHVGRPWMIVCAAFQLLSTLSHPVAHFLRNIGPLAYLTVVQLFSYGVCLTLALSVLARRRDAPPTGPGRPR